jgi:transposase
MEAKMTSAQHDFTLVEALLAVSLELSQASWKVALHDGRRGNPAVHTVKGDRPLERLMNAVALIKGIVTKWAIAEGTRIVVSYEAGQEGFWIYRELTRLGYEVVVVDPASIQVDRRARRAKTDRLDAILLVGALLGWLRGETRRMHVIRVPSEQEEAQRHVARDRGQLQKEMQQHRDRISKLLRTVGCWEGAEGDIAQRLRDGRLRRPDGSALSPEMLERLEHECIRLNLVERQFKELERTMVAALPARTQDKIAALRKLKGVGEVGALRLTLELFWRNFENRRQVGSCVGLCPQPYDSGVSRVDQGISKAGNRRVRALLIEMSWLWLRYQPDSALARWFTQRTQGNAKRGKRIAIVAVARKLVIDLWRYLKDGVVPSGAVMKRA